MSQMMMIMMMMMMMMIIIIIATVSHATNTWFLILFGFIRIDYVLRHFPWHRISEFIQNAKYANYAKQVKIICVCRTAMHQRNGAVMQEGRPGSTYRYVRPQINVDGTWHWLA
jgi:hypothetical protein